jgi:hypothetical protein
MLIYSMSVSVDGFSPTARARSGGRPLSRSSFVSTSRRHASSEAICAAAGFTRRCWCGRRIRRCATTSSGPRSPTSGARSRRSSSAVRSTASRVTPGSPRRRWPRRPLRRSTRLTRTSRSAAPAWRGDRARPRRRAAHVPLSGRRRWRHAVPAAGHRRRPGGPNRDQDVRLAGNLRALRARPR